ncbi:MAG: hypothetical protein J5997_04245 [Oscillospiraceae bacterium]|nr:hypothetical protein [Oscillospiraceae bacterium]
MPRKKHYNNPMPAGMNFLNDFENKYPNCWNEIDKFINNSSNTSRINHKELVKYEANSLSGLLRFKYKTYLLNNEKKIEELFLCLYSWKEHKQIFNFDRELFDILIEQATDFENINIPYETLLHPFFPVIYVNNHIGGYDGFFAFFDELFWEDSYLVLNFLLINSVDDTDFISIPLNPNETLKESLKHTNFSDDNNDNDILILSSQLLQLFLYLCAENKDVESCQTGRKSTIKNTYKELNIWNVGLRIGNSIRKGQAQNDQIVQEDDIVTSDEISSLEKQHKRKRAHSRRGHWHHYWKGSKKSNNQYLVLKWIAPTFINCTDDNKPFVQHSIE